MSEGWQGWGKRGAGVSVAGSWLSSKLWVTGLLDIGEREEHVLLQVGLGTGDGSGDSPGEAVTKADGGRANGGLGGLLELAGGTVWLTPKKRGLLLESHAGDPVSFPPSKEKAFAEPQLCRVGSLLCTMRPSPARSFWL